MSNQFEFSDISSAAWKSRRQMIWPCMLGITSFLVRMICALGMIAFLGFILKAFGNVTLLAPENMVLWGLFSGVCIAAFSIFRAACRLMWWRGCAGDIAPELRPGQSWIRDIPAVLVIDLLFGIFYWGSVFALVLSFVSMIEVPGVFNIGIFALSGVLALSSGVVHRACLAGRLMYGGNIIESLKRGVRVILHHPVHAVLFLMIPLIFSLSAETAMFITLAGGSFLGVLISGFGILAASWVEPVLWGVLMRGPLPAEIK